LRFIRWAALAADFDAKLASSGLGLRELAAQLETSHSNLSRLRSGGHCSAELFVVVCLWMNKDPRVYLS
jgi:hypothetical protein